MQPKTLKEKLHNFRIGYLTANEGKEPKRGYFCVLSRNDFVKFLTEERFIDLKFEQDTVKRYFMGFELDEGDGVSDGNPMIGYKE